MALWLFRAGSRGEYERKFLDDERIYLTWDKLREDLANIKTSQELGELLAKVYPEATIGQRRNWTGQVGVIAQKMNRGDWIVLPSKLKTAAIHVAEVTGPYVFDPKADDHFYHYRKVKWIATDLPRSIFDQDLLYSFGALQTICKIERNDAEVRIRAMAKHGWHAGRARLPKETDDEHLEDAVDLERLARDQIAKLIIQKFQGHGLAALVDAILRAQGYTTHLSPAGADKGVDILAAPGALGFGMPRICVQVKSGDAPVDSPTLNQLIGAMQNVQADQGLLVSWGGFKSSVDKEIPAQFFRVRLWDQDALIGELLAHYDRLDEDLRAELPLKRIWTVTLSDDE